MISYGYSFINVKSIYSYLKHINNKKKNELNSYNKFVELQRIIKQQSLTTFFQPIVNLQTGNSLGFEALNRPPSSNWFPTTEGFYEFVGKTDQMALLDRLCRNISLERFFEQKHLIDETQSLFINIHPQVLIN